MHERTKKGPGMSMGSDPGPGPRRGEGRPLRTPEGGLLGYVRWALPIAGAARIMYPSEGFLRVPPMNRDGPTRTLPLESPPPDRVFSCYTLRIGASAERVDRPLLRVGSGSAVDLHLDDPSVSRLHFEIEATSLGYRLRDLGSRNGTFVNGCRAVEVFLEQGSRIVAGRTDLRFELLREDAIVPASPDGRFGPLVGHSTAMRELFAVLERAAPTDATVLIEGESGTGKELAAQAVHLHSRRAGKPFVVFDCAAVPHGLVESALFGHEKGAFTGASNRHVGAFEEADGGTLFLDELGELAPDLQPKLLRALETHTFRRVGGTATLRSDARIVAATNRDLALEMNAGTFREDLYYRLAVVHVRIPPLRERPSDIRPIVRHLLTKLCRSADDAEGVFQGLSEETWSRLERHPYRGNVRELRNLVERGLALSDDGTPLLEPTATHASPAASPYGAELPIDLDRPLMEQKAELVARFERCYLTAILEQHDGNISQAARAAGLDRMYFKQLLKKRSIS